MQYNRNYLLVQIYFALFVKIQVVDFIILNFETPACVYFSPEFSQRSLLVKMQGIDFINIYFETPAYGYL